ncbi:MAG: tRNA uridine-5-carboxymethylaminomethyl(34) synthesis GTPase MnmE [Halioglobus sp.]
MQTDTIVAVATAAGRGGIGIVRVSGPLAESISLAITRKSVEPRTALYTEFWVEQEPLDSGLCLYFPSPNSFTGECVVEFQAHGGPVVLDLLVREAIELGARQAEPGEFSQRAFLNDKLDLAQAEAIADLINSSTEQAARSAGRSLKGAFSKKIHSLSQEIIDLRIFVEAAIDFPEEEIDFIGQGQVKEKLSVILEKFEAVNSEAKQGTLLTEGMKLVIVGKPNAGKSSLLNALSGRDLAIVTAVAGTTRDVLRDDIQIAGMPVHIVDTAGLRDSEDEIEQEGIRRAHHEMESADHLLLVTDSESNESTTQHLQQLKQLAGQYFSDAVPITVVANKCDLVEREPTVYSDKNRQTSAKTIVLSAKTGAGMDLLKQHLADSMGYKVNQEGQFSARRRHLEALKKTGQFLSSGQEMLNNQSAAELLAEDLRHAHLALGEITGTYSTDDLLGDIFSSFCIGK